MEQAVGKKSGTFEALLKGFEMGVVDWGLLTHLEKLVSEKTVVTSFVHAHGGAWVTFRDRGRIFLAAPSHIKLAPKTRIVKIGMSGATVCLFFKKGRRVTRVYCDSVRAHPLTKIL